jgi:glycosyl transferase family 25
MAMADERRKKFAADAADAGLAWEFFDAHTGIDRALSYDPAAAEALNGRTLLPGELGCYSSHAALWQRLIADDAVDQYIVLEDDVVVDWTALRLLHSRRIAEDGHDYIRLFHKHPSRRLLRRRNYLKRGLFLLELLDMAFGTQGYVLNKAAAARFLKSGRQVIRPVDDHMDRYWDHGVPNLALYPALLFERTVPSSINNASRDPGPPASWSRRIVVAKDKAKRRMALARILLTRRR